MTAGRVLVTPRSLTRSPEAALRRLEEAGFSLVFSAAGETPGEAELLRLLPGCVGWIAGVEPVSTRVLEAATALRAISRNGTGVDNLPLDAAKRLGIRVLRADGANARGVAELAVGLVLASLRAIPSASEALRGGAWRRRLGTEIGDRTVGVVGCGAVGQRVARAMLALDARVLGFDPFPRFAPPPEAGERFAWRGLDELLAEADIVTLHCPPPADGKPLLDAGRLGRMRPRATLVNTARASLVDETALVAALDGDRLAGYATDVFDTEPPPDACPLLRHERVVATPHVGGFTGDSLRRATEAAVDNLLTALDA